MERVGTGEEWGSGDCQGFHTSSWVCQAIISLLFCYCRYHYEFIKCTVPCIAQSCYSVYLPLVQVFTCLQPKLLNLLYVLLALPHVCLKASQKDFCSSRVVPPFGSSFMSSLALAGWIYVCHLQWHVTWDCFKCSISTKLWDQVKFPLKTFSVLIKV